MSAAVQDVDFVYIGAVKPPELPIKARQCGPPPIYIPEGRPIRPLPPTAHLRQLDMYVGPVALASDAATSPTKRSLTQRHMHNYSLPSPLSLVTSPRPTQCQSASSPSEFRQAVYISATVPTGPSRTRFPNQADNTNAMEVGPSDAQRHMDSPLLAYSSFAEQPTPNSHSPSASDTLLPTLSSKHLAASLTMESNQDSAEVDPDRLSGVSLASLHFPLPVPFGPPAECEWEVDPFADASGGLDDPPSKWSPTSSTHSLGHHASLGTGSKSCSKKEKSPSGMLKDFLRLGVSAFHIGSSIASVKHTEAKEQRSKSLNNSIEVKKESLVADIWSQRDDADIVATPKLHPHLSCPDLCSAIERLDDKGIGWNKVAQADCDMSPARGFGLSSPNVDALSGSEDGPVKTSIPAPSPAPFPRFPHASPSTTPNMPSAVPSLEVRPHSQLRALPIPPSHTPPLSPYSQSNPPSLDFGFPSPPILKPDPFPAPSLCEGEVETQRQGGLSFPPASPSGRQLPCPPSPAPLQIQKRSNMIPAVPPRSKLRPTPVKVATTFSKATSTQRETMLTERGTLPHTTSSSIASHAIPPLSSPALRSEFTPTRSFSHHSHSPSVASSLLISPLDTPPILSPDSTSPTFPLSGPFARWNPEPQIDTKVTGAHTAERSVRTLFRASDDPETEVKGFLASIRQSAGTDDDDWHRPLSWQEDSRPPPPSFYRPLSDIDSDTVSIYSQLSAAYTFRTRSVKRQTKRSSRRRTAMSMLSVYSQASFFPRDTMDVPPIPALPWALKEARLAEKTGSDNGFGQFTVDAASHTDASPPKDDNRRGPEAVALTGQVATASTIDLEAGFPAAYSPDHDQNGFVDCEALSVAKLDTANKRPTSSNISIVDHSIPIVGDRNSCAWSACEYESRTTSVASSGASSLAPAMSSSPQLIPNRRRRTLRLTISPPSSHRYKYESSSTSVNQDEWHSEAPSGYGVYLSSLGSDAKERGVRSGLRELRKRLVSLTLSRPSTTFAPDSFDRHHGIVPPPGSTSPLLMSQSLSFFSSSP